VVIPIMTIFIGYFCINIYSLNNSAKESKKFAYLSIFFIVAIFLSSLSITSPMLTHIEFQGAVQAVSDISNLTPQTDTKPVIYFQDDMTYEYLATPLTFYFDKIPLKIPINKKEPVEDHLLKNNNSYLITRSGAIPILNLNNLTKIDDYSINEPMYEKSYTTLPTNITRFRMDISIYKIKNTGQAY
jgi:hypothetical protein